MMRIGTSKLLFGLAKENIVLFVKNIRGEVHYFMEEKEEKDFNHFLTHLDAPTIYKTIADDIYTEVNKVLSAKNSTVLLISISKGQVVITEPYSGTAIAAVNITDTGLAGISPISSLDMIGNLNAIEYDGNTKELAPLEQVKDFEVLAQAVAITIGSNLPVMVNYQGQPGTINLQAVKNFAVGGPIPHVVNELYNIIVNKGYSNLNLSFIVDGVGGILVREAFTDLTVATFNLTPQGLAVRHLWYDYDLVDTSYFDFRHSTFNSDRLEKGYRTANLPAFQELPIQEILKDKNRK